MSTLLPAWAWWLAAPAIVTLFVAVLTWWLGRPRRPLPTARAMQRHQRFLAALDEKAASTPRF